MQLEESQRSNQRRTRYSRARARVRKPFDFNATGKLTSYDVARNLLRECISDSSLIGRLACALFGGARLINRDSVTGIDPMCPSVCTYSRDGRFRKSPGSFPDV